MFKLYETVDRDDTDWMIRQWGIIKEFRTRTKDVIENMVDHESSKIKNAKDQDLLMLQTHAIQQEMSFQDQWFHKMRGAAEEEIEKKAESKQKMRQSCFMSLRFRVPKPSCLRCKKDSYRN